MDWHTKKNILLSCQDFDTISRDFMGFREGTTRQGGARKTRLGGMVIDPRLRGDDS